MYGVLWIEKKFMFMGIGVKVKFGLEGKMERWKVMLFWIEGAESVGLY